MRRGRRQATPNAVIYVRSGSELGTARFGFIVAKTVGNAVHRNLVRRRLKSIAAQHLAEMPEGTDIVIRALPGAAQASWASLNTEIAKVLSKGKART